MLDTLRLRPLASALALLAAATACQSKALPDKSADAAEPAAPPITQAQKDASYLQYAQIRQMEALGTRCQWLGPAEQVAVAASHKERHAWMTWQQLDMAKAEADAKAAIERSNTIECSSTEGKQHWLGLGYGAWQMRSSWAMRGYTLLPTADRPNWFAGKSSVARHRPALEAAIAGLKAIDTASVEASLALFQKEAEPMLAVRCKASDKGCPKASIDPTYATYAEQVLQQAEAYAVVLEEVDDKAGKPPEPGI